MTEQDHALLLALRDCFTDILRAVQAGERIEAHVLASKGLRLVNARLYPGLHQPHATPEDGIVSEPWNGRDGSNGGG